jgi:hypothetical protein
MYTYGQETGHPPVKPLLRHRAFEPAAVTVKIQPRYFNLKIMKTTLILTGLIVAALAASAQLATDITLTNLQGRVYSGITVDHTNNMGLVWTKPDGSEGMIKYKDLPPDQLARYRVSAKTVAAAIATEDKNKKLLAQQQAAYAKSLSATGAVQTIQVSAILDETSNGGIPLCSVEYGGGGGSSDNHPIPSRLLLKNLPDGVRKYLNDYNRLKSDITALEDQPITVTANSTVYNSDGSVDQYGSQLASQSAADDAIYQAKEAKRDKLELMNRRLDDLKDAQFERTMIRAYPTGQTFGSYEIWACTP